MRCRVGIGWMVALSVLVLTSAQAAVRVALVGPELEGSGVAALGLAEAELSGREGVELLDRATVGRVLREQDLAAGGLVQAEDAIRLGQVLAVDVFIHVEPIPGQEALGVVGFETAEGIRLLDEVVPGPDVSALAEQVESAVGRALEKWQKPVGQTTAIALLSVRNVDLPKSRNGECDSIGVLLERRLLGSPDVVVVERKRLQSLNIDREIASDRPGGRLLAAPVLVELDIEQAGGDGGLRAAAHLSNASGGMLGMVRAGAKSAPQLADKIASNIWERLDAGAMSSMPSPQLESVRFFRQARFWKAQGRYELALASAEAAYALDPVHPVMRMLLMNALLSSAGADLVQARPQALAYAARGMAMLRQPSMPPVFTGQEQKKQFTQLSADVDNFFRGFGDRVGQSRVAHPFTDEEAADYADFCRDWLARSPYALDAPRAASSWDLLLFVGEPDAFEYFPDYKAAWQVLIGQIKRWCRERLGKEKSAIPPWDLLERLVAIEDGLGVIPDYRARAELWTFFEAHGDSLLGWFGRCGRVFDDARQAQDPERMTTPESRALLADLAEAMRRPASEVPPEALGEVAWMVVRRNGGDIGTIDDRARRLIGQQLPELADWILVQFAAGHVHERNLQSMRFLLGAADRAGMNGLRDVILRRLEPSAAEAVNKVILPNPQQEILTDFRDWLREQIEPGSTAMPPVANARIDPIDLLKPAGYFLGHAAILGDDAGGAYVISASGKPPKLMMQEWSPNSPVPILLGTVEPHGPHKGEGSTYTVAGVKDAGLGPNHVAVAVADEGIYLFDRSAPTVTALHETTALPVTHPLSVGILDQTLYVGTDDGYLVSFNLNTLTGTVLVASSRKEKRSPFDDGPPVHITAVFPDPDRNRIVFLASVVEAEGDLGMAVSRQSGIWEYRPATGAFEQRIPWRHRSGDVRWSEMLDDGTVILGDISGLVLRLDLSSDTLDLLSRGNPRYKLGVFVQELIPIIESNRSRPIAVPIEERGAKVSPPFLVRDGWLWTAQPRGRLSMTTYQWEKLPPFRMPDGQVQDISPNLGMMPIGDHQVLLAERGQLWRMTTEGQP